MSSSRGINEYLFGGSSDRLSETQLLLSSVAAPVRIPSAVLLFGSALGLMGVMRRKISR